MDARGVIHHLCDLESRSEGDPETVLRSIRQHPMNRSAIAKTYSTPRKTIRSVTRPFEDVAFVSQDDEGLQVTGAGEAFLGAFERALDSLTREQLEFLSATPNRRRVLLRLRNRPARKSELAADTDLPSRTTIQRIIQSFTERGWTVRDASGRWRLTEPGDDALAAYEDFLVATEQAITNAPILSGLGELSTTLPLAALADAELVQESRGAPHVLLQASLDLAGVDGESVSDIKAIVPIFSTVLYNEYLQLLSRGTRFRVICDSKTAARLHETDSISYLNAAIESLSVEIRFYPGPLDFGVATYDGTAMIAVYPEESHPTALISQNPELVDWAASLVEEYWEQSVAPTEQNWEASGRQTDA